MPKKAWWTVVDSRQRVSRMSRLPHHAMKPRSRIRFGGNESHDAERKNILGLLALNLNAFGSWQAAWSSLHSSKSPVLRSDGTMAAHVANHITVVQQMNCWAVWGVRPASFFLP